MRQRTTWGGKSRGLLKKTSKVCSPIKPRVLQQSSSSQTILPLLNSSIFEVHMLLQKPKPFHIFSLNRLSRSTRKLSPTRSHLPDVASPSALYQFSCPHSTELASLSDVLPSIHLKVPQLITRLSVQIPKLTDKRV